MIWGRIDMKNGIKEPKRVIVDVNLHLPQKLIKYLQDGEIICPRCNGTGIVKSEQSYGIKGLKNKAMFPFTKEYMIPCPNCYDGTVDICKYCGQPAPSGSKSYTPESQCMCVGAVNARKQERREKSFKIWEKAEKIDYAEALKRFAMVYIENWDRYVETDDLLDAIYKEPDRYELRVYGTSETKIAMDADNIIENACEDLHDDADDNLDRDELQELLDKWCKDNESVTLTYWMDYGTGIVLTKKELD